MKDLKEIKTAYFLGIGGIGMSAIARYFKSLGMQVYGYDRTRNAFAEQLENEGFIIHYQEDVEAIPKECHHSKNCIVVYTPAIPSDHKELRFFLGKRIPVYKRSEVLGIISGNAYTIAVAGTHGKTTTSTMIAHLLNECGVNFTAFLGGISSNFNSNYIKKTDGVSMMDKELMVLEADEFDRSFLQLNPDIAIVTSTDADHLDIYGEADEVKKSFQAFIDCIKDSGTAILKQGLELKFAGRTIRYGEGQEADVRFSEIRVQNKRFRFRYTFEDKNTEVSNALPGFHNVENASAAITACLLVNLPLHLLVTGMGNFKGVKRRFEYIVDTPEHVVIDDYAHHPTELKACISSVRELYPEEKICGIFQPHLYSRTRDFADDFAEALDMLDECWLMDIYPARELPIEGINSEFLALKMKHTPLLIAKENILKHLEDNKPGILLLLGAGDIDQLIRPIKKIYEKTV